MGQSPRIPAVIFDIDNTILYHTNRSPFNWSDLSGDTLIPGMDYLIDMFNFYDYYIIIMTGRPESVRTQTEEWLSKNGIIYDRLIMKPEQFEKGFIFKQRELVQLLEKYDVKFAFDDDVKCANMYKENGVIIFQPINYIK
jgi:hypothetical protein